MMPSERISLVLAHLLVAILLVSSHPPQPDCYASYGLRIKNEVLHSCSLWESNTTVANASEWNPPKEEFKLYLINSEQGVLSVKFPLPDSLSGFEVILLINKSARTEEECRKSHFNFGYSTHSKKVLFRGSCKLVNNGTTMLMSSRTPELMNGGKTVYMETHMHNVFTGCYRLKIVPRRETGDVPKFTLVNRYSLNTFIKSSYEKAFIQTPSMTYDYSSITNRLSFSLRLIQSWGKYSQLALYSPKPECDLRKNIAKALVMDLSPNVTIQQCETTDPNHKRPACHPTWVGLDCTIYNITPGNYCIRAEVLNEERCELSTVWTEGSHSCVWTYTLVAAEASAGVPEKEITSEGNNFYIYIVLGTIVSLVLLAGIIHGIRSLKPPSYEGHKKSTFKTKILPREKVLLLYAHDCSPFMDLMATFRSILQKMSTCEVYDVFDPVQWGTIACGRQEWVYRLLSQDDVMTVIVDSTSAVLHQNALENNYCINYFQPRPNSHLFTYALQAITNRVQRNVYKKIFVVRFKGFSEEGQTLRHVAPLRRYLLPDHLHQLLSSLKDMSCLDLEDSSLEELRDTGDLHRQLDNLISYKAQQPDYLKNVLYRTSKIT